MRSFAIAVLLSCALAAVCADGGLVSEAVICRGVSSKGQPVSPNSWFPAGITSLTLWFRTADAGAETLRGEVRWLLGNSTLATREVDVRPGGFGFSTYSLAMDEPLPSGTYQAVLSVGNRQEARAVVRVGGKAPEREAVKAIIPEDGAVASGSGLRRSARSESPDSAPGLRATESASETSGAVPPSESAAPEVAIDPGTGAGAVAPPAVPPAAGAQTGLQPDETVEEAPAQTPAPAVPVAATGTETGGEQAPATPPAPPAVPTGLAGDTGEEAQSPSTVEEGSALVEPPTLPAPIAAGESAETVHIVTVEHTGLRRPAMPVPPPAVTQTDRGQSPPATEDEEEDEGALPTGPSSTPLGPRTAKDGGPRPLVDRSRASQGGAAGEQSAVATRSSDLPPPAPLLRTRQSAPPASETPDEQPSGPRPALRTAPRVLSPAAAPDVAEDLPGPAEPIAPPSTSDGGDTEEEPGTGAGVSVMPAPEELPSPATTPGGTETDTPPANEAGQVAAGHGDAAGEEPSGAATAEATPPAEAAPPAEVTEDLPLPEVIRFEGPLVADAIAEDLPPLELSDQAVELHRVELVTADDTVRRPGIEPYWVMKVPDGRLWPPSLPHQFPLYAGPDPAPNPEDLFLYSDHIDGIMPLYEVPLPEAGMHMARENQAGLLSVSREMYDVRRQAWQSQANTWQWLWYVRDVDLSAGDLVTGYLTDLKRSRRVPEDFQPGVGETLFLLNEQGQRVWPLGFEQRSAAALVEALGDRLTDVDTSDPQALSGEVRRKGLMGLALWQAPQSGRYQLWAALPLDKCQAQSLVWVSRTGD